MQSLWQSLRPGLRGKLALLVGSMLFALIGVILAIVLKQQRETISSLAEAEIARYLDPVEKLSLEIDQLVESLVALEELRMKVDRAEQLNKSRRNENRKFYYTSDHIKNLEGQLKRRIWPQGAANDNQFKKILVWAKSHTRARHYKKRQELEKLLRQELGYQSKIKVAFESLDLQRYRAESIGLDRWTLFDTKNLLNKQEKAASSLNKISWGDKTSALHAHMNTIYNAYKNEQPLTQPLRPEYRHDDRQYLLIFRTMFRNQPVSGRAILIQESLAGPQASFWNEYLYRELNLQDGFQKKAKLIKDFNEQLEKNQKAIGKADRDREKLRALYVLKKDLQKKRITTFKEYSRLLDRRETLLDTYRIQLYARKTPARAALIEELNELRASRGTVKEKEAEDRILTRIGDLNQKINDFEYSGEDHLLDAYANLREAALMQSISIATAQKIDAYDSYNKIANRRKQARSDHARTRRWLLNSYSSLRNRPGFRTRSINTTYEEALDQMFTMDSTSIQKLLPELLTTSTAGFTRILMDQTESLQRIRHENDSFLDTAMSIGLRIIFLSFLFSGAMVSAIKGIIGGADRVGRGDLNVHFNYAGKDELGSLVSSLNGMVHGLREREELRGELSAAEEIQKQLLPTDLPVNMREQLSFGLFYKAMHGVGGDYYDLIPVGTDSMAICVADVSNHGVGPAIVMTLMRAQLRAILRRGERDPKKIVLELNDRIYVETPENIFITMFLGIYNKSNYQMQYISAGHNPAVVYEFKQEKIREISAGGMPVGAVPNDMLKDFIELQSFGLNKGDLFFQYTDGVNEAMDAADAQYGTNRLLRAIKLLGKKKPETIVQTIARDVEKFSGKIIFCDGPSELNDDIAMLAFRRLQ